MSKKENKKTIFSVIPGFIISAIVFILEWTLSIMLVKSQMVPVKYVLAAIAAEIVLIIIIFLLTHRTYRKVCFVIGTVISVAFSAVMIYAVVALSRLTNTLDTITTIKTEIANVGVYVLTDDDAETLNDLENDVFGILDELDRDNTDKALNKLNTELGVNVSTAEYSGLTYIIDALYDGECRAIILNSAYLDVLSEMEGYEDIDDNIREVTMLEVEETVEETAEDDSDTSDSVFTVYISGIDSRNGLLAKSRSDVNILAVVNTETHQILLVSTPRDYYVELSISNGAKDKLTHAGIYGVQVSMDTLAMLYDTDVDYYFRICFEGVEDIVDALGGVSVYSEYAFSTGTYSYTQGYNYLNGEEALAFVRERHAFASGDRQRGKNQMALIQAVIDAAISPEILTNYSSLLASMEGNFETSVSYNMIASLVNNQLEDGGSWDVITYSVDGTGSSAVPYSMSTTAYVMIPDETTVATAKELIQSVLAGEVITQPEE